ncbi:MAG TPA: hypothetical protein VFO49_13860 [Nocardioides sp.]|nr:hypothetical protein [Nocardioides sp.]
MGIKRVLNSRIVAVAGGAAVLAVLAGGAGFAAGQINSGDIENNSVRSVDVKDGDLKVKDLSNGTVNQLQGKDGKDGKNGVALAGGYQAQSHQTINLIGGSFATNKTELGSFELEPGVYLLNGYAAFDTEAADSPRTEGTHLMLALRGPTSASDKFGEDLGTCFTGAFPQGDREATCQVTRTVVIDETTTVDVIGFGYNEDQSGTGGGTFKVLSDVTALKVS